MNDALDFTALKNAIGQLKTSLDYSQSQLAQHDEGLFYQFRAATIKAFEYTYEISIKFIRRYLETTEASSESIDALSYRDLIRVAYEKDLVHSPEAWFSFREKRNITSHTYNDDKAELVYTMMPDFLKEVEFLFKKLTKSR
jgi:nucleotidyltransferase substrate binding protein (TIGR01987 family)